MRENTYPDPTDVKVLKHNVATQMLPPQFPQGRIGGRLARKPAFCTP